MSLFKNGTLRPLNKTLNKKKNFYIVFFIVGLLLIFAGIYFVNNKYLRKDVHSDSKNIGMVNINATDTNGKRYYGSWTTKVNMVVDKIPSNSAIISYTWYKDGKVYNACKGKTCVINTTQSGYFSVAVKTRSGIKDNVIFKSISVRVNVDTTSKISSVSIVKSGNYLSASVKPTTSKSGYKYQWYKNDKLIGETSNSILVYPVSEYGTYKVKVTTGSGSDLKSSSYFDVCYVSLNNGLVTSNISWSTKDVTLNVSMKGPIKTFNWYKDGKVYNACKNKNTCKITTSQKSNYCVTVVSKNGPTYSSCLPVWIDKSVVTVGLYANGKKLTDKSGYNSSTNVKLGTTLNVQVNGSLFCANYNSAFQKVEWRENSKCNSVVPKSDKKVSTNKSFKPTKKGCYYVWYETCNYQSYYLSFTVK